MSRVTEILQAVERAGAESADELLPVVYDELRRLAAQLIRRERPGQTLQPTALVHEAWLRLVNRKQRQSWAGRRHFLAAAAEAMRRILVENARRKQTLKRGGQRRRLDLREVDLAADGMVLEILALDEALARLAQKDPRCARLVELRYFAGLTIDQAAGVLGVSARTAKRDWTYARAWLRQALRSGRESA